MSDQGKPAGPDLIGDWIKLLHFAQIVVHACATPFRLLWTVPGTLGRWSFGRDALIGLMFAYPLMCQKVSSRLDGILCMRLWALLWWLLVIHAVAAFLLNRRNRVHRHEHVGRTWLGHFYAPCIVLIACYLFLKPHMSGLGNLFTWSSLAYLASNRIVDARMNHAAAGARDAEIEGRDFANRMGG